MAITRYQCGRCDKIHDYEHDAEECCMPDIYELYFCDICDKKHNRVAQADECCADQREQADPLRPTATKYELEAAGQRVLL